MKKTILKKENYCNSCGKKLKVVRGITMEGAADIRVEWGYFSERDGQKHKFTLCEACYNKITSKFKIPVFIFDKMVNHYDAKIIAKSGNFR